MKLLWTFGIFLAIIAANYAVPYHHRNIDTVPLIVGGIEATPHEFPWIVTIQRASHTCGGAIIDEYHIVTAAHCSFNPISVYTVIAGEHNLAVSEGYEQYSTVEEIIVHEDYDDLYMENDIAVWKLSSPFVFNDKVQPAPLASPDFVAGGVMVVAGWGRLSFGGPLPDALMKVDVPLISLDACRQVYPQDEYPVWDHNICAGYLQGQKDSCNGDSGGPLMCDAGDGSLNLCGLVSWGGVGVGSCASPNEPGVYASIASFHSWILQNIN